MAFGRRGILPLLHLESFSGLRLAGSLPGHVPAERQYKTDDDDSPDDPNNPKPRL
jgi:hypothetical protein